MRIICKPRIVSALNNASLGSWKCSAFSLILQNISIETFFKGFSINLEHLEHISHQATKWDLSVFKIWNLIEEGFYKYYQKSNAFQNEADSVLRTWRFHRRSLFSSGQKQISITNWMVYYIWILLYFEYWWNNVGFISHHINFSSRKASLFERVKC